MYLNGHIRRIKRNNKTEVRPVIHVVVLLSQTGGHEALSDRSLEVEIRSVFHEDVEVLLITATRNGGWDCQDRI